MRSVMQTELMCMTQMSTFAEDEAVTVTPMHFR